MRRAFHLEERMDKNQILKQYFGYDSFREGQEELINSILEGRDTFGIMPTGSGKSLCFQVPALMMEGITLVISPLISLMKDQVMALNQAGVHAAFLNSSLSTNQYFKALSFAKEVRYKIIYVAPERLLTESFLEFAVNTQISMLTIDEVHCVSQWGQDFRPSYLKIVDFIKMLPQRPVISAFTATATKEVREDIVNILELEAPFIATTGYDRPNLYLEVQSPKDKYSALREFISLHPDQCGIVYCLTRKLVEEVSMKLVRDGFSVTRYHAGLGDYERQKNQDDFIYDRAQIMIATNAFGMGIDKSNVRFVIHYNMPKSIEAYYQEIGRCSRDGEPGVCLLYYGGQDVVTNQLFVDNNQENKELDYETREIVLERDRERLRKMTFYCFTNECLRDYILRYFGEYGGNYCGNCSNCLTQFEEVDVTEIAAVLIGCVQSCRQRYGTNVILDTVRGAKTAKIRQYRMDENPHYGELATVPIYKLRQVMNYLMLNEYLAVTNDEYTIVKLTGKSKDILEENETIIMKMAKEQEHQAKTASDRKGKKNRRAADVDLDEEDEKLFESLRSLRAEIARKEGVPPYIVFSDKSLVHMCVIRPVNKNEMLSVGGVGEFKFEKYGEQFLQRVKEFSKEYRKTDDPDGLGAVDFSSLDYDVPQDYEGDTAASWEEPVVRTAAGKKNKTEFVMTEEIASQMHYAARMSLSDLVGQMNDLRDENNTKRLTIKAVEQMLLDEGLFELKFVNRVPLRQITEYGTDFGIEAETRISSKGNEYEVFYYTEEAQRGIVELLLTADSNSGS